MSDKCVDCKFFERFDPPHEHCGSCKIKLPRWLTRPMDDVRFVPRIVRVDDGCNLHAPKEAEGGREMIDRNEVRKIIRTIEILARARDWPEDVALEELVYAAYAAGAKAEREACAKVCYDADKSAHPTDLGDAIRARRKK